MRCIKWKKVERTFLRTLKVTQSQLFNDHRRVFNGQKIIYITIAKSKSLYLITWSLTAVRAGVICYERMVVQQWLELEKKRNLKDFCVVLATFNFKEVYIYQFWHFFLRVSIWRKRSLPFVNWAGTYVVVEFSSHFKTSTQYLFQIRMTLFAALLPGAKTYLLCYLSIFSQKYTTSTPQHICVFRQTSWTQTFNSEKWPTQTVHDGIPRRMQSPMYPRETVN